MMRTQNIIFPDSFNDKWLYEEKKCEQKKEPNYSIIILCRKYELVAKISNEFPPNKKKTTTKIDGNSNMYIVAFSL